MISAFSSNASFCSLCGRFWGFHLPMTDERVQFMANYMLVAYYFWVILGYSFIVSWMLLRPLLPDSCAGVTRKLGQKARNSGVARRNRGLKNQKLWRVISD